MSMTLGATFYAIFIANLSALIMTMDTSGRQYEEKVSEVKQYLKFRRVPMSIQKKVLEYYDHRYQRKYFDEPGILFQSELSHPLRKRIVMHNCKNLVEKVPFLASAPTEFLYDLILQLQFEVFFPGDIIVQGGKKGDSMYFIEYGKVAVKLPNGLVVKTLGDGDYFGEIALLLDERRVADVVVLEVCDVYKLTRTNFDDVLQEHPRMKSVLERIAKQRLEETTTQGVKDDALAQENARPGQGLGLTAIKNIQRRSTGSWEMPPPGGRGTTTLPPIIPSGNLPPINTNTPDV